MFGAFSALGQTWCGHVWPAARPCMDRGALTVLDTAIKVRLSPLELRRAGAVIENMQSAGFDEVKINIICRALVCAAPSPELSRAAVFPNR